MNKHYTMHITFDGYFLAQKTHSLYWAVNVLKYPRVSSHDTQRGTASLFW